jgi:hypothetical protein
VQSDDRARAWLGPNAGYAAAGGGGATFGGSCMALACWSAWRHAGCWPRTEASEKTQLGWRRSNEEEGVVALLEGVKRGW